MPQLIYFSPYYPSSYQGFVDTIAWFENVQHWKSRSKPVRFSIFPLFLRSFNLSYYNECSKITMLLKISKCLHWIWRRLQKKRNSKTQRQKKKQSRAKYSGSTLMALGANPRSGIISLFILTNILHVILVEKAKYPLCLHKSTSTIDGSRLIHHGGN